MFRRIALSCSLLLSAVANAATGPTIADFAAHSALQNVKLSPSGEYIAAKVQFNNGPGVAVIRLSDNKLTASKIFHKDEDFAGLWWIGPSRILVEPAVYEGGSDVPHRTGMLLAINADGSGEQVLLPGGGARLISVPRNDPKHVIVEYNDPRDSRDTQFTMAYKVNLEHHVANGGVAAPMTGYTEFLADDDGEVRYAVNETSARTNTFSRKPGDKEWTPVNAGPFENAHVYPLVLSSDGTRAYLSADAGTGRYCLFQQVLASGEISRIACDENLDLSGLVFSFDGAKPIAAIFGGDGGRMLYLEPDHPDSILLKRLQLSFPNQSVRVTSRTDDGSKIIIAVMSDREPGSYYLVDTKSAKATLVGASHEAIYPDEMSERRPISFQARDGTVIHGYLTVPRGHDLKSLPLVVHPHGGPLGVQDTWLWDAESQLMANRSYAVLQVNFRGSSGYGQAFLDAGRQQWDGVMIDDITDGARWAIRQGYADPSRLCIYGASYGAYAALESAVREPDLYKCAVMMSGVYDLNLLRHDSDITNSRAGNEDFAILIGNSKQQLSAASPINQLDRLKAAVFIAHGELDQRAPVSQAEALMKALEARRYAYEKLIKPDEEHGFYDVKNRVDFFTRLIAFLDRNIGATAAPEVDKSAAQAPEASR